MTGETGEGEARGGEDGNAHRNGGAPADGTGEETGGTAGEETGDRSLVVIVPAALRPEAIALGEVLGYTISFDFPLSADGGATVTHFALHAGAGPVMRLVLAGEGGPESAAAASASSAVREAFAALAASGIGAAAVAAFRAALLTSVHGGGESYGLDHLREVCAAEGLVFAAG